MPDAIDRVNRRTMRSVIGVRQYLKGEGLFTPERAALDAVAEAAHGKPILDIGVGGGRTVRSLMEVSPNYLGVDYSREMLKACRRRHPGANLRHLDARRMDGIADASIYLVMFSCNGVCMVSHEDRLLIMREVFRVLQPGGAFLFSTFNQDSPEHVAGFRFPSFVASRNPAQLALNALRFVAHASIGVLNRARFARHEVHTSSYSIINDTWHDYGTMLYYISLANQRRQLEAVGFEPDAVAYDGDGHLITSASNSPSIFFVARKPA